MDNYHSHPICGTPNGLFEILLFLPEFDKALLCLRIWGMGFGRA
jgi:hypothetical protein